MIRSQGEDQCLSKDTGREASSSSERLLETTQNKSALVRYTCYLWHKKSRWILENSSFLVSNKLHSSFTPLKSYAKPKDELTTMNRGDGMSLIFRRFSSTYVSAT